MDMKQLAFFVETYKCGSIQRASDLLHISPSGLRLSLHRLEDELETSLICWGAKSFELTAEGEYFVRQSINILQLYDACRLHFKLSVQQPTATIASGINFPSRGVGESFLEFGELHPDLKVSFTDFSAGQCDEAVRRGECEIGFNTGPFNASEFEFYPLFEYSLYVVINISDPVSQLPAFPLERLKDYQLILADMKPGDTMFSDYCTEKGVKPEILSRIKRDSVIFRCVAENPQTLGVTYKEASYGLSVPQVKLMPFEEDGFKKTVYMFHKKRGTLTGAATAFKEFVLQKIRTGELLDD